MKGSCGFIRVCGRFGNYFDLKYSKRQECWFFTTVLPFITYPESNEFMSLTTLIKSRDNYLKIRDEILEYGTKKDIEAVQDNFEAFLKSIKSLCHTIGLGNYPPLLQDLAKRSTPILFNFKVFIPIPFVNSELEGEFLSAIDEYINSVSNSLPHPQKGSAFQIFTFEKELEEAFNKSKMTVRINARKICGIAAYKEYFTKNKGEYQIPTEIFDKIYFKMNPPRKK